MLPKLIIEGFRDAGFSDAIDEYGDVLLTKDMPCGEMPGVMGTVVDGICVTKDTICTANLSTKGVLQLLIEGDDFEERYNFSTNKKGFCEVALDAGVKQEFLLF